MTGFEKSNWTKLEFDRLINIYIISIRRVKERPERVMAYLSDNNTTTIHLTILMINLKKELRDLFDPIVHWLDCFSSADMIFKLAIKQ